VAGAGADGPVSADPPETVRPLDPAKKVAATQEKVAAIRKKVAALKISCGGLFTHFDRHIVGVIVALSRPGMSNERAALHFSDIHYYEHYYICKIVDVSKKKNSSPGHDHEKRTSQEGVLPSSSSRPFPPTSNPGLRSDQTQI